jgi:hypothetical protein
MTELVLHPDPPAVDLPNKTEASSCQSINPLLIQLLVAMAIWWSIIKSVAPITTSPSLAGNLIDLVKSVTLLKLLL